MDVKSSLIVDVMKEFSIGVQEIKKFKIEMIKKWYHFIDVKEWERK